MGVAPIPGPWQVCSEPPNDQWFKGLTIGSANPKDARRICDLSPLASPEMNKALGALICAAPDLLEALRRLIARGLDEPTYRAIMSDPNHYVNAAIRKATGGLEP